MKNQILGILKKLRAKSGIRVSMVIDLDGKILGIHEDASYVPKSLRLTKSEIDKEYFSKWSTSIHKTIEFVSEKLFQKGIKNMIFEGYENDGGVTQALLFDIDGKAILIGLLTANGSIGLAYQAMRECVEKISRILD